MFRKIVFLLFTIFNLTGCENSTEQNTIEQNARLQLSFKNNSTHQLNNLKIADKIIGSLPVNTSSGYLAFDKFRFDTGLPDEDASAMVNGILFTNHYRGYWCGTEKIIVDSENI